MTAEIEAMVDVLAGIGETADSMSPDTAAGVYEALTALSKKVGEVKGLVEQQLKTTLEQPRVIGTRLYASQRSGKWRPNHQAIKSNIISTAMLDLATGEMRDAADAAMWAVDLTYDIFVAPATEPKVSGLAQIGFKSKQDASEWEHTGSKLVVTELGFPEGTE